MRKLARGGHSSEGSRNDVTQASRHLDREIVWFSQRIRDGRRWLWWRCFAIYRHATASSADTAASASRFPLGPIRTSHSHAHSLAIGRRGGCSRPASIRRPGGANYGVSRATSLRSVARLPGNGFTPRRWFEIGPKCSLMVTKSLVSQTIRQAFRAMEGGYRDIAAVIGPDWYAARAQLFPPSKTPRTSSSDRVARLREAARD